MGTYLSMSSDHTRMRPAPARPSSRPPATQRASLLKDKVISLIPQKRDELKDILAKYGERSLGQVTVGQALRGAHDVKCMYWDGSLLDSQEGIRFRGFTIPELQAKLPPAVPGGEPTPEGELICAACR